MPKTPNNIFMIRMATTDDLSALLNMKYSTIRPARDSKVSPGRLERVLHQRILDQCLLVTVKKDKVHACAGIDLARPALSEWLTPFRQPDRAVSNCLLEAIERLAVQFGILDFSVAASRADVNWYMSRGYRPVKDADHGALRLEKSLRRRQTAYGRKVLAMSRELGIPQNYGQKHRLMLQVEARRLNSIGADVYGRDQKLRPGAAKAWMNLQQAAAGLGISIQAVSAWRSVDYQRGLLKRKLDKGQTIDEILKVSAAPGFSEHHTGRAIDITTPGFAVLEEEFERSEAFTWMKKNASDFGFRLSFPRRNRHRLTYEPWHWCFQP